MSPIAPIPVTHERVNGCDVCGEPHPKCYGHSSKGKPCGVWPIRGGRVCRIHGGSTQKAKDGAARNLETMAATTVLTRALREAYGANVPDIAPSDAMLQAVSWKYAEVVALRAKVAELDEHDMVWGVTKNKSGIGPEAGETSEAKPNIWWVMLRSAEDQLVKFAAGARAAGCDEARVRIAERQGNLVAQVMRSVLDRLDLTPAQQTLVGTVVPEELRRLASGAIA